MGSELIPGEAAPLLKRCKELMRDEAIQRRRQQGWRVCASQWIPPPMPRR